jgi:hypothetical protein
MSTVFMVLALFGLICLVSMLGLLLWALIESLSD